MSEIGIIKSSYTTSLPHFLQKDESLMRKSVNLKRRLDQLRGEEDTPVALDLQLNAQVYREIQQRARRQQISPASYIAQVLAQHLESDE